MCSISVYPAFQLGAFFRQPIAIDTSVYPEGYFTLFPTGSFEGQSVEYFQPAPLDTLRDARLYNFPQRAFSVDIQFSQFNIGDSGNCQGNEDMENWFAIRTAPQPPTFNYQCVGRNTLPAPLEFQLKPEDYETRISLSTTEPVSPASVSLALKYKGQFYHFDKFLLTDI